MSIQKSRLDERQALNAEQARAVLAASTVKSALMGVLIGHQRREFQHFISVLPEGDVLSVALYGRTGNLLALGTQAGAPAVPRTLKPEDATYGQPFENAGGRTLSVRLPIENGRSCRMCHGLAPDVLAHIEVSLSHSTARDAIGLFHEREFIFISVVLAALVLALVSATELFVVRPLRRLTQAVKKVEIDQNEFFSYQTDDEIGTLATRLNDMLSGMRDHIHALESYHFEIMRQAQKMSTIGELASALAHEIKNPMAGISGAMQVFMEDCPKEDPRREVVKEVQSEIERLDRAFKDLLSFARSHERHPVKTNIGELLYPAARLVSNQAKKQKVHVNIEHSGTYADIYVDPEEMQQVFLNIMVSALQDMPDGGMLDVNIRADAERREIEVSFSDSGEGIPVEDIETAFEPVIASGRSSRGLELGISRRLVEHNGGRITVVNRATGGATYTVVLPIKGEHV